jgi:hypothetical protein
MQARVMAGSIDIHDGTKVQTCAPCQIQFVRDRKEPGRRLSARSCALAKKWRNRMPKSSHSSRSPSN